MSLTAIHGLGPVKIGSTVIGGVTDASVDLDTNLVGEPTSGEIYTRHQSIAGQKPGGKFTSNNIAQTLAVCASLGCSLDTYPLTIFAAKRSAGAPAAGAVHRQYVLRGGLLVPRQLTCEHQGDASLSYEAIVAYDGGNDPIVKTDNVSLPAGLTDLRYSLYTASIGGLSISDEWKSLTIDWGIEVQTQGGGSEIWDSKIWISKIEPTITLRGIEQTWFDSIPLLGAAATNATIVLRKRADGGTWAGSGDVTLTASGIVVPQQPLKASGDNPDESTLLLTVKYDGTNVPIRVS